MVLVKDFFDLWGVVNLALFIHTCYNPAFCCIYYLISSENGLHLLGHDHLCNIPYHATEHYLSSTLLCE